VICMALGAVPATRASSITYAFDGSFLSQPVSFTLAWSGYITADTKVPRSAFTMCVNCGTEGDFDPDVAISVLPDVPHADMITFPFALVQNVAPNFTFDLGAFTTPGTYQAIPPGELPMPGGTGTLVVQGISKQAVPEPSTGFIVALFLAGAFLLLRWRHRVPRERSGSEVH
jgi:hypothetical protein